MNKREIYQKAFEKWGSNMQLVIAIEELSELQKVCCKKIRGSEDLEDITDEIADVEIMCEQLRELYGINEQVDYTKEQKIMRLDERIKNAV